MEGLDAKWALSTGPQTNRGRIAGRECSFGCNPIFHKSQQFRRSESVTSSPDPTPVDHFIDGSLTAELSGVN